MGRSFAEDGSLGGRVLSSRAPVRQMQLTIETERENDGRWIAEVMELAGVMAYGTTREDAVSRAKALALRVVAERMEQGEPAANANTIRFAAA